jgi:hypothetical protein
MADRQATLDTVRKQVEFYFSDSNYPKDKFLRSQAAQNDEGCIFFEKLFEVDFVSFTIIKMFPSVLSRLSQE